MRAFSLDDLRRVPRKRALLYALLGAGVVAFAAVAFTSIYGTPTSAATSVQRTATVTRGTVQSSVSASGNIASAASSDVSFSTSGTLTSLAVAVGDKVKAGDVIATIDPNQAKANLASARASLAMAETTLATARAGGTASQLAQAKSTLSSAKLQLLSAKQALADNRAAVTTAQKQLATDEKLGCLPATSSPSTGSSTSPSASDGTSATPSTTTTKSSTTTTTPSTTTTTPAAAPATTTPRTTASASASLAPAVVTGSASGAGTHSITLAGTVTPEGAATKYWFQYGTSTSFGSSTRKASAGKGKDPVTASLAVSGLKEATTYIFRIVAESSRGTRHGSTESFTTATSACTNDRAAIKSAEKVVSQQENTVRQQGQSVASTEASNAASVDSVEVAQDEAQVEQDGITVSTDERALAATTLRAPISGTVTAVNAAVGDTVGSSSPSSTGSTGANPGSSTSASSSSGLVTIQKLNQLEVVAGFPEADALKIAVGQPATISLSALTDTEVAGKVTAVSPTSTVVSNVVTYDVTISLINPPSSVKLGMTSNVSVAVATHVRVLELPSAAITTVGSLSTVTVLRNSKQTAQTVTTGLVGSSTTEIVGGLTAGETVVEPTASLSTGTGSSSTTLGGGSFPAGGGFAGGGPPGGFGG